MLRTIIKEIGILIVSLSLLPGVIAALLWYQGRPIDELFAVLHRLITGGVYPAPGLLDVALKWASPYLALMAVRALWWTRTGSAGRIRSFIYFSMLSLLLGASIFTGVWDTFYFMYQLGDIPGEWRQFVEIESRNLILLAATVLPGLYCLASAIYLSLKLQKSRPGASVERGISRDHARTRSGG